MNRHHHQLVFNRARGALMAVGEGARRARKSASGQGAGAGAAVCWALLLGTAQAQIVADPRAPGNQRPTILTAPNGVPLVNIQTPSPAGVSLNQFGQFDVGAPGAILNNSRTATQTQLGGGVAGNPWLATGSARVIVNQVNSNNPSYLNGPIEVAGQRAEVIVANPSGIQVNGSTFINASGVTLTTGVPVFKGGSLDSYIVQRGSVGIFGAGLDTRGADYTAIFARATEVNAGLWANYLKLVNGANTIDAATQQPTGAATPIGEPPRFLLDVAHLGGMYANHIFMVGTEKGLGVNNEGVISSAPGNLELHADGRLINKGALIAGGELKVDVKGHLDNTGGHVLAAGPMHLSAQGITNDAGELQAQGDARIDTRGGDLQNRGGRIGAQGALALQAGQVRNEATADAAASIGAGGRLSVQADALHNRSALAADGSAVHATLWAEQGMDIRTQGALSNDGRLFANGSLAIAASDIGNQGTLEAGSLELSATGELHNAAGASLLAGDAMGLSATTLNNQGLINVASGGAGALLARADTFNNRSGGAVFADHIAIDARELNNRPDSGQASAPVIAARESLNLGVHTLNNEDSSLIYSDGDIRIGAAIDLYAQASGQAQAVNNLSADIEAMGDIALSSSTLRNERRDVTVTQVSVLDQTAQLDMPSWWFNGKNKDAALIEFTSNYTRQHYYLLDPASILSEQTLITPDGNTVRRVEVALDPRDSVYHAASGAYAGNTGVRERVTIDAPTTVVLYASVRQDGVANPDQVSGAPEVFGPELSAVTQWQRDTLSPDSAYGRCTTHCTLLVAQPGYDDPLKDLLRSDHTYLVPTHPGLEVSRTAHHTAIEDRLAPGAGAPAAIRSGGSMRLDIGESLSNRHADILAGTALDVNAPAGAVDNMGHTLKRTHQFHITSQTAGMGEFEWTKPEITEVIGELPARLQGGQSLHIQAKDLSNIDQGRSTGLATSGLDFVGVNLPSEDKPLVVGNGRLFTQAPSSQGYLIETDPRFTDRRQWLGSDYLLTQLASDPNAIQKRLGDGFYEQKLIREQLAELTGRRFLDEFHNDEAQFLALMEAGIAYAQAVELKPGIALTAEQMAQLTTDLVWLVQREVVLPDGTTTTALVPQVYLRAVRKDALLPSGALIAGQDVVLDIQQDLVNAGGRIEGDVLLAQAGRDITNIGGLMQARSELLASAGRNLTISSPTHTTRFSGEHVTQSRTELAGIGAMRVTGASGVTGDGPDATLSLQAGQDVVLQGASVSNAGLHGSTRIEAGRDVQLQTVTVGDANSVVADARNYRHQRQSQELGSDIAALGDIHITAGHDVTARAASVQALGDVSVQAGNDIRLEAGRATSESDSSLYHKRSGPLSKKTNEEVQSAASDVALGSSVGGANVVMQAGRDVQVQGSEVNAQHLLLLDAGRDVLIASEENRESGAYFKETKQSGMSVSKQGIDHGKNEQSGSGSFSRTTQVASTVSGGDVFIVSGRDTTVQASTVVADELLSIDAGRDVNIVAGVNRESGEQSSRSKSTGVNVMASGLSESITFAKDQRDNGNGTTSSATAAASTVGSLGGDVVITAGRQYQQTGSDVLALAGDVDIEAESVAITEAREARSSTNHYSSKSTVLGATPRNALVDAIKSAETTRDTAKAISETGNSRVQAIGAVSTALNAYNTVSQAAELMADPTKMASVTIDFNLGSNRSRSESAEGADAGRTSTVAGAGDVRIRAKGAGEDSDILIRGSDVSAGGDALLKADGNVNLESSQDRAELHSRSDSSGASVGVGVTMGASWGITFNASANRAEGNADGQDTIQRNTHIVAGNTARIESGGDTTLAGAVVSGESVQADVGGNLLIESRQDESSFKSDQQSSGWGMSLCIPPFCYGASSVSVSGGAQNIESEYASVNEQSGLKAGDGGFQVNVGGNTILKGGAITSTDKAIEEGRNRFDKGGELILSDVQNHARYEAQGYEVQVAVAVKGSEATTPEQQNKGTATPAKNEGSAGIGEDSGEARSTTNHGISKSSKLIQAILEFMTTAHGGGRRGPVYGWIWVLAIGIWAFTALAAWQFNARRRRWRSERCASAAAGPLKAVVVVESGPRLRRLDGSLRAVNAAFELNLRESVEGLETESIHRFDTIEALEAFLESQTILRLGASRGGRGIRYRRIS